MEHSKLTWEDIIKFEEVAGYADLETRRTILSCRG